MEKKKPKTPLQIWAAFHFNNLGQLCNSATRSKQQLALSVTNDYQYLSNGTGTSLIAQYIWKDELINRIEIFRDHLEETCFEGGMTAEQLKEDNETLDCVIDILNGMGNEK